jgi:hypothetical protein
MSLSGLKFAGDVNIEIAQVRSSNGYVQDVKGQIAQLEIFEDMFAPFISGTIVLTDALDLINFFPFIGEEYLKLKVSTPSFYEANRIIDGEFYLFKMDQRILLNDKNQAYAIHFISKEAVIDSNFKISRSFEGVCSDIATRIVATQEGLNSTKSLRLEQASNKIRFVANFWSPTECLKYLSNVAVSDKSNSTYLFFENRAGFNFTTLNDLYSAEKFQSFIFDNKTRDFTQQGTNIMDPEEGFKRVSEMRIDKSFDYLSRTRAGVYASKMITHDYVSKKYAVKNYNLLKDFPNHQHLNKFPIASSRVPVAPNALQIHEQKHFGVFSDYTDISNTKYKQQRISLLRQAESFKVQIVVPGRTDYTVGMKVSLLTYKTQQAAKEENTDDLIDKVHSGDYLIAAINHVIDKERHECHMELIKDSMIIDLDKGGI